MRFKKAKRSKGKSRIRSSKMRLLKIIALVVSIPVIVIGAFLIRYYYIFNGVIEEKLGKRYSVSQTEIYAAPEMLFLGKRMSLAELQTRLRRLNYAEVSTAETGATPNYQVVDGNHLILYNDYSLPEDGNRLAEVTFSDGQIRSLVDVSQKQDLEKLVIKPEMLSNAINENREKRRYVSYQDLPMVLVNAVLASEDRRFFSHRGIDPIRIVKALIIDVREGDKVQGASTLTQQYVKNYFLTPERTWRRKFADAYMSILLETRLSKEEIFELYSNEVYLGQAGSFSIVGFGEAAGVYFGKSIKELTLDEAATLAGIISAPNRFAPIRHPDRAKARRDLVLDQMAEYEMITVRERDDAKAKALEVKPTSAINYSGAPYFVDYVQDILLERFGDVALAQSKYKVYTTLNAALQQAAFESLRDGMVQLDDHFAKGKRAIEPGTVQASLIAVDPRNGQVLAMIGGRNYGTSQYNRITQSKRQPGSIFKPFVYAAALETAYKSATPLTVVSTVIDEPTNFAFEDLNYDPRNFKDEYHGQVTMRQAITKSLNVATIKFAEKAGYSKVTELAHRLGLNEQIKPYPAMAIGSFEVTPLEMVRAYTAFANGGLKSELTPILAIHDSSSNPVFVAQTKTEKALTPQIAFLVTSLLQSVMNEGTGAGVRSRGFTLPAAGKTGTSRDGWFAGYTPELLCIVWVGFDDNRELNLSGSQAALPIWTDFMKKAIPLRPLLGEEFAAPEGVPQVEIDPTTGLLATSRCLERQLEYFIPGTEPTISCYGNNYEQLSGLGIPASIYSTPAKDTPVEENKNTVPEEKKKTTQAP
jgi:penicillin-binding protein 1B